MHLYLHIPFCRQACHYCDFHFTVNQAGRQALVDAIGKEAALVLEAGWPHRQLKTVYLGGGTPSILGEQEIGGLIEAIKANYDLSSLEEFTLEANPDDVTAAKLEFWQTIGIDRISLGVQSFEPSVLERLNRSHTAAQAQDALKAMAKAGVGNFSLDLIFGLPGQTMESLARDLEIALSYGANHISIYGLTIEERTVFGRRVIQGAMTPPEEGMMADMMAMLMDAIGQAGLEQYEISNFARPGHRARHNSAYWSGAPYLGLGPSAHSFDGGQVRWANVASNGAYLSAIDKSALPRTFEHLTPEDRYNERVMVGLRLIEGINLAEEADAAGLVELPKNNQALLASWATQGLAEQVGAHGIRLLPAGRMLADGLAAQLFC